MNGDDFHKAAHAATASTVFDSRSVLGGVYAKNRSRTRARRAMAGLPIAAALAVGGVAVPSIIAPSSSETAVAAYRFDTTAPGAPLLAEIDGIKLHYLPDSISTDPVSSQTYPYFGGTSTQTCFEDACVSGLAIGVTRRPGLTLENYFETNWFGDPVETTVGDMPAFANGVKADDASGLVWSPEEGVVVEVHFGKGRAAELRKVVEAMSL